MPPPPSKDKKEGGGRQPKGPVEPSRHVQDAQLALQLETAKASAIKLGEELAQVNSQLKLSHEQLQEARIENIKLTQALASHEQRQQDLKRMHEAELSATQWQHHHEGYKEGMRTATDFSHRGGSSSYEKSFPSESPSDAPPGSQPR